jgi:hypothetical protein
MGNEDIKEPIFAYCKVCGKRLLERKANGLWYFAFGKPRVGSGKIPVEMFIQGNVKIKCLRRSCNAWNIFNLLPTFSEVQSESSEKSDCSQHTK